MQVNQDPDDVSVFLGVMKGNERVRPCIYMFYLQKWGIFLRILRRCQHKIGAFVPVMDIFCQPRFFQSTRRQFPFLKEGGTSGS
jgi:hypothetical protein